MMIKMLGLYLSLNCKKYLSLTVQDSFKVRYLSCSNRLLSCAGSLRPFQVGVLFCFPCIID